MTIEEEFLASLTGDSALMALLTGGVHSNTRIDKVLTPGAYDINKEILPCALLKFGVDAPSGPHHRSSRWYLTVYFYQRIGYDTIRSTRDIVYNLWHEQKVGTRVWLVFHANDINDAVDTVLGCSMIVSQYEVVRLR